MKKRNHIPVRSYRLPDHIDREIRALSKKLGISQARVICSAIEAMTAKYATKENKE
jgi:predicted DNA-binding protein